MALVSLKSNVQGKQVKAAAERAQRARQAAAARPKDPVTFGILVGNRGFFPGHLAESGRREMLEACKAEGYGTVVLGLKDARHGAVESREEAKACAALFRKHAGSLAGIIVTLPNFGDERAVAETLRMADLGIPVLVHATSDDPRKMGADHRRDAFCGKMSACNVLRQYGIPFTLTSTHTQRPESEGFRADLRRFAATCRVARGLKAARIGAIGARPAAFKTVRYSEKLLEASGIAVETIDLSEILGRIGRLADGDRAVKAKLGLVVDRWMQEADVTVSAIQCWTALEEFFGVVPCTIMSMMSDVNRSSACEVDVLGTVSMHALALASETPAALLDWNNNYGSDPDKAVCFHCSNLPRSFFDDAAMDYQAIIAGTVGRENTYGTIVGTVKAGPMSFARFSTDDVSGCIRGYVGEGEFTKDPLKTFGGAGVVRIPNLQPLLRHICTHGFEHHVAMTGTHVAGVLKEAFETYLGWETYQHLG